MKSSNCIWITGAGGQVGQAIVGELDCVENEVLTSDQDIDVTDLDGVTRYADINHPDIIIHCAAYSDEGLCEENVETAYRVNALGARNIATAARRVNAKLIYLSTDDVFGGGGEKPLTEFDLVQPETVYGKSKYAGEQFVRELCPKHLIVRSAWIYGNSPNNFLRRFIEQAKESGVVQVPNNEISSPTSARELARFIVRLADSLEYGIYHASCEGICTRYEFACEIARLAGLSVKVEPVVGKRSSYTMLDNLMMRLTGIYAMPDWKKALEEFMTEREVG